MSAMCPECRGTGKVLAKGTTTKPAKPKESTKPKATATTTKPKRGK